MDDKPKEQKTKEMVEFILPRIAAEKKYHKVQKFENINVEYIRANDNVLVLMNKEFSQDEYKLIIDQLEKYYPEKYNFIFHKDKVANFCSATFPEKQGMKSIYNDALLKLYDHGCKTRVICPNDAEKNRINNIREATYYQPKSPKLEEKLVTYQYLEIGTPTGNGNVYSDKYFIWTQCKEHNGIILPSFNKIRSDKDIIIHDFKQITPGYNLII